MTTVAGVDGCRAGWIVFVLPDSGDPDILVTPRFQEILDHPWAPEIIAVDALSERRKPPAHQDITTSAYASAY